MWMSREGMTTIYMPHSIDIYHASSSETTMEYAEDEICDEDLPEEILRCFRRIHRDPHHWERTWARCSRCCLEEYYVSGRSNRKLLHTAILWSQTAVGQQPDNPAYTQLLAACLTEQYSASGNVYDLQNALENNQSAVRNTKESDPEYPKRLQNLATTYRLRYQRSGNSDDLMVALDHNLASSKKRPRDPSGLQNLGASLTELYWNSNNQEHLQQALEKHQEAFQLTPFGCREYLQRLQNLATSLRERYKATQDKKDLYAAIRCDEKTRMFLAYANFAAGQTILTVEAQDWKKMADSFRDGNWQLEGELGESIEQTSFARISDADCAASFQNLALSVKEQHDRRNDQGNLDRALEIIQSAVRLLPMNNPRRHHCLQNWALLLVAKFWSTNDARYLRDASAKYAECFESPVMQFLWSLDAAQNWESIEEALSSLGDEHKAESLRAHAIALDLLSDVFWLGNSLTVRQVAHKKMQTEHITSDALSICIMEGNLHLAIEFAERGLAVIFQQRLQLNRHTHELLAPDHAKLLETYSVELVSRRHSDPYKSVTARQKLLDTIRGQPGLEKFLHPKEYSDLCQVSQNGPVVLLNSHSRSCNAIILLHPASQPICINLDITVDELQQTKKILKTLLASCNSRITQSKSDRLSGHRDKGIRGDVQQGLGDILSWLQFSIVFPIYRVLECNRVSGKRLWWCPLGKFTGLPLHAADMSDKFVQSYTPSPGVLLDAMKEKGHDSKPKIGVVGLSHTNSGGDRTLSHVEDEVKRIVSIAATHNVELQKICGSQATVEEAKKTLQTCNWMHFACHGVQNPVDPTKSSLQLYDDQLDLGSILQMSLPNPEFVFLAACQTAKGDTELVNESLHLGGAFIAAGFKAAIGTMWTMMDEDGPSVAETVYSHLFDEGRLKRLNMHHPEAKDTAEALQIAVKKLRDSGVPYERWMPFIHIGV